MQLTSIGGSMVIDFYPIKNKNDRLFPNHKLKVLSFRGKTIKKSIINYDDFTRELTDRIENYDYKVTDNKKSVPQYHTFSKGELAWVKYH